MTPIPHLMERAEVVLGAATAELSRGMAVATCDGWAAGHLAALLVQPPHQSPQLLVQASHSLSYHLLTAEHIQQVQAHTVCLSLGSLEWSQLGPWHPQEQP